MILRNVPFINWDEWISVRNGLYSSHGSDRIAAVRKVEMWRIRGNVPHSVDLTAQLVDIRTQDPHFNPHLISQSPSQSILIEQLRLLYSIIVIRSVNGIVEPNQTSYFAQSILTIAEKLGLPGWIVELRHDATHKQIPSLSVLRAASDYLLNWYNQNYWQPQESLLQALTVSCIPIKCRKNPPTSDIGDMSGDSNLDESVNNNNTKSSNEQWYINLQKNSTSSSFLVEIFLPFFTGVVTSIPWQDELNQLTEESTGPSDRDKQYQKIFQTFIKHQLSIWKAPLHCLLPNKENWLHACLCRLLLVAVEILSLRQFDKIDDEAKPLNPLELSYNLKLILFWCKYLMELYFLPSSEYVQRSSDKRKKKNRSDTSNTIPQELIEQRKQFIRAMIIRLHTTATPFSNDFEEVKLLLSLSEIFLSAANESDERLSSSFKQVEACLQLSTEEMKEDENIHKDSLAVEEPHVNEEEHEEEEKEEEGENKESHLGKRKNVSQSEQIVKKSKSQQSTTSKESKDTITYLDYLQARSISTHTAMEQEKKLLGIQRCSDFPVWPLGLLPGRYECNDLYQIEEIISDDT